MSAMRHRAVSDALPLLLRLPTFRLLGVFAGDGVMDRTSGVENEMSEPESVVVAPDYYSPAVYKLYREYFVANYLDGDDSGVVTINAKDLANVVAEMFSTNHWRETWNEALIESLRTTTVVEP